MILAENRPKGMSQLDWLWLNYHNFNVSNEASEVPSERIILTEQALTNLIQKATSGGITTLIFEENPDDTSTMRLVGNAVNGEQLTLVTMPKEEHIISFTNRQVTQTDVDAGCTYGAGTNVLAISTNLGNTYMVSLADLDMELSGTETNTVYSEVINGVVTANVKIDENNNANSAVKLKSSTNGLYSQLVLDDSSTGVKLSITENGLAASLPITGGTEIRFSQLTLDEYMALEAEDGMVYFITDYPYIYLNGTRYGVNIRQGEYPIVSLVYDQDSLRLYYKKADGSDIQSIDLGPASAERGGMLSAAQYTQFEALLAAIGNISDVSSYVTAAVKKAAFSLEKGEVVNYQYPLYLKDGYGNTLSTVLIDDDNFLTFAEQHAATADEVKAAAEAGITVSEGDTLLILTLTSGNKVYVNLKELVNIYRGEDTNTASVSVMGYDISASVRLAEDEHILYESVDGLRARLSIKQSSNTVAFYGKTEDDEDKLGEFIIHDQLLGYRLLKDYDNQMFIDYPPAQVDGKDYDAVDNPVVFGNSYIVLTLGLEAEDEVASVKYNWYIDITAALSGIAVSTDKDNLLSKGSDGNLYASLEWNDVN